jgi:hypothetical protein
VAQDKRGWDKSILRYSCITHDQRVWENKYINLISLVFVERTTSFIFDKVNGKSNRNYILDNSILEVYYFFREKFICIIK